MAAALLVGVLLGAQSLRGGDLVSVADGGLVARGALARALDDQLAGDAGAVRIGVSFRTADGGACRTFSAEAGAFNGLACKDDATWRIDMAMRGEKHPATEFRTAAAETPTAILERAEAMMAGEPLDAVGERAARDAGWRR
jgi:hypothetical protein